MASERAAKPVPTPMPIMAGVDRPLDEEEEDSPSMREPSVSGGVAPPVGSTNSVLVEVTVSVVGRREVMVTAEVTDTVSRAPITLWFL